VAHHSARSTGRAVVRLGWVADAGAISAKSRPGSDAGRWYVGRRHVHDDHGDPVVVDWRADVSLAFYRATRIEPMDVTLRRRFGFERGTLTAYEDEHLTDRTEADARSRILAAGVHLPDVVWQILLLAGAVAVGYTYLFGTHSFGIHIAITGLIAATISLVFVLIIALDYPFPATYAPLHALACTAAGQSFEASGRRSLASVAGPLAWTQLAAALFDYVENTSLLAILAGLLIYAWIVGGHRSPAYPETQFVNILYFTAVVVAIAYVVISVIRRKPPGGGGRGNHLT